jgi:DNA-binding NarL/FixJ family response regulator
MASTTSSIPLRPCDKVQACEDDNLAHVVAAAVLLLEESIASVRGIAIEVGESVDRESLDPAVRASGIASCPIHGDAAALPPSVSNVLTARQLEVLQLLTVGMTNRGIARKLGIAEKTVKNHMQAIFNRLQVADRTQAAVYAVRHRLVA